VERSAPEFKNSLIIFFLIFTFALYLRLPLDSLFVVFLLKIGIVHLAGTGIAVAVAYKTYKGSLAELLKIAKPQKGFTESVTVGVILCYISLFLGIMIMQTILNLLGVEVTPHVFGQVSRTFAASWQWLISIILLGVISPFAEEIIFRRFLYTGLKPKGRYFAIVTTSAIFSLIHFVPVASISYFLIAVIFQRSMNRHNNLLYPYAIHVIYNTSLILITYFLRSTTHV